MVRQSKPVHRWTHDSCDRKAKRKTSAPAAWDRIRRPTSSGRCTCIHRSLSNKRHVNEWSRIDFSRGEYMSASMVHMCEGGTLHDIAATWNVLEWCLTLGATLDRLQRPTAALRLPEVEGRIRREAQGVVGGLPEIRQQQGRSATICCRDSFTGWGSVRMDNRCIIFCRRSAWQP